MKIDVMKVKAPILDHSGIPVMLTDETIEERKQKSESIDERFWL